jgi:hypothetical protein
LYINDDLNIELDDVPSTGTSKILLEVYALWIEDNNFGILLRPIIISFFPNYKLEYNYSFLAESEEDEDSPESVLISVKDISKKFKKNNKSEIRSEMIPIENSDKNEEDELREHLCQITSDYETESNLEENIILEEKNNLQKDINFIDESENNNIFIKSPSVNKLDNYSLTSSSELDEKKINKLLFSNIST